MIPKMTIQVPASTTNLGAGFDTLGLALQLYLKVEIEESRCSDLSFTMDGEGAADLPRGAENLIACVMRRVFEIERKSRPPLRFHVSNQIPIARGLGSSAAQHTGGRSALRSRAAGCGCLRAAGGCG